MKNWSVVLLILFTFGSIRAKEKNSSITPSPEFSVEFQLNNSDGVYKQGEEIVVTTRLLENGRPAKGKRLRYVVKQGDETIETKEVSADASVKIETSMERPGWCMIMVIGTSDDNKTLMNVVKGRKKPAIFQIGVMVDPLKIKQGAPPPDDFAAFWKRQKSELDKVPLNVKYKPIPGTPKHRKASFVTVDCAKGFRPVEGILHTPANVKPKSLPIAIHVHGAGVHNSPKSKFQWAPPGHGKAKGPRIFFNLNAHGIPNDQPPSFYEKLRKNELKNYPFLNSGDQENYYMKGMILRLIRALQFLKTLPEWNGEDIVVSGGSQGGAQSLFAAGADPQVTEIYADVPAMCDFGAPLVDRCPGWPKPYVKKDGRLMVKHDYGTKTATPDNGGIVRTCGYFDAANFAKNIRCKVRLSTGGVDGVCPPSSVFAAYNNMPSNDKEIKFAPLGGHCRGFYTDTDTIKVANFDNNSKKQK